MKWHKEPYMLFASKVSVCNLHPFTMAFRHLRKTHLLKASALKLAKDCSDSMLKALTRSYVSALVSLHRGNPWKSVERVAPSWKPRRRMAAWNILWIRSKAVYVYICLSYPSIPPFLTSVWSLCLTWPVYSKLICHSKDSKQVQATNWMPMFDDLYVDKSPALYPYECVITYRHV